MGKVAVEGHEVASLVESRLYAQVFQAVVLLGQAEIMQADHADGIVEGGGLQVELSTGRHFGVGYLQPARQLVGGVGGIEVDVRVACAVVFNLADVALGGYLFVYDTIYLNPQGYVA